MTILRMLACQIEIPATSTAQERDRHIERCAGAVRARLEPGTVDLVVLPELSSIDYSRESFERLEELAEPPDGVSFQAYRELARDCGVAVVYGFARRAGNDYAISQAAIGPDGTLMGCYDKIHIAQFGASMEKDYFTPGRRLLVLDLKGIRAAPIICYDIRFPELGRTLCLDHGVELILHCGAYYRDESFPSWHAFVTTRAMENQCFVLSLNRAGQMFGSSMLCPPQIDADHPARFFHSRDEELRLLEIDTAAIHAAKRQLPFIADKLEDYDTLECMLGKAVYTHG